MATAERIAGSGVLELSPDDQMWLNQPVVGYNMSRDRTFRGMYAKRYKDIAPASMVSLPRAMWIHWIGNPRLREDPVLWFREIEKLRYSIGSGTQFFDYWFGDANQGPRLIVPDLGNDIPGFYRAAKGQELIVDQVGEPIPEHFFQLPSMPAELPVQTMSSAEYEAKLKEMEARFQAATMEPKVGGGSAFGPVTTEDQDFEKMFEQNLPPAAGKAHSKVGRATA